MSILRIVMAGHVVVPIPFEAKRSEKTRTVKADALVLGVHHKPTLSVPLEDVKLRLANLKTVQWPRAECIYVDSSGRDYVMIDITNCSLRLRPATGTSRVKLGNRAHLVDLSQFLTNNWQDLTQLPTFEEAHEAPGIAARLELDGTLAEDRATVSELEFVGWEEKKGKPRFRQRVARFLTLSSENKEQHRMVINSGVQEFTLVLATKRRTIECYLTSLCGWTGKEGYVLDLDHGRTMFAKRQKPNKADIFPNDIVELDPEIHPGSSVCDPAEISYRS